MASSTENDIEVTFDRLRIAGEAHRYSEYFTLASELGILPSDMNAEVFSMAIADQHYERNKGLCGITSGTHWDSNIGRLLNMALNQSESGTDARINITAGSRSLKGDGSEIFATYTFNGTKVRDVVATYDVGEETANPTDAAVAYLRSFIPNIQIKGKKAIIPRRSFFR